LLNRRPASNSTSNWAMTGPVWISTTRTLKPKSRNVFSRIFALRRTPSLVPQANGSPAPRDRAREVRSRTAFGRRPIRPNSLVPRGGPWFSTGLMPTRAPSAFLTSTVADSSLLTSIGALRRSWLSSALAGRPDMRMASGRRCLRLQSRQIDRVCGAFGHSGTHVHHAAAELAVRFAEIHAAS